MFGGGGVVLLRSNGDMEGCASSSMRGLGGAGGMEVTEVGGITAARVTTHVEYLSPYRFSLTDGSVRKKSPGTLIFVFDHETVPMYRTYVLCTRERRNISLIEM